MCTPATANSRILCNLANRASAMKSHTIRDMTKWTQHKSKPTHACKNPDHKLYIAKRPENLGRHLWSPQAGKSPPLAPLDLHAGEPYCPQRSNEAPPKLRKGSGPPLAQLPNAQTRRTDDQPPTISAVSRVLWRGVVISGTM